MTLRSFFLAPSPPLPPFTYFCVLVSVQKCTTHTLRGVAKHPPSTLSCSSHLSLACVCVLIWDTEMQQGRAIVKNKVDSVGRFLRMYQTLRQEKEAIIQLKGIFGSKLPPGMLIEGGSQLKKKIDSFDKAKDFDAPNEHIPSVDESGNVKKE
mmetsp:Transcript_30464/g.78948  ORF Transcript_30464/g.78948 Transcript_30464/m.78948 type:complete len:152 (+) Transcript_30464:1689-2144(+)